MANNVQAPLASAEASPVENQDGALLSPLILHYSTIAYALVIGAVSQLLQVFCSHMSLAAVGFKGEIKRNESTISVL
uniref:Transmembrane protein n=1 Tax=Ascaris lumbricoides TaxID=6252 RepID=A0A0M3HI78_ASCLU